MNKSGTVLERRPRRCAMEAGSAYIAALLALVVLSILGLSVALITQTEMLIGANERSITRVLYAADSGINEAIARLVVFYDYQPKTVVLPEPEGVLSLGLRNEVDVSWILPILDAPCNLCQINQGGDFSKINHALTVRARRTTDAGGEVAAERVAAHVELEPRQSTIPPMNIDDEAKKKIQF